MTSCCNLGLGFQLAASIPPYAASATVAAGATTTVTGTSSPSSSPSSTNNSLGIGLGVALGVVLLAAAAIGLVLYRRHQVRRRGGGQWVKSPTSSGPGYNAPKSELEQPSMVHEIPSRREPVEMDGGIGRH